MFPESFYLYCFERGVDGILIASCGTDSPYKGTFEQLARQVDRTYELHEGAWASTSAASS